MAVPRITLTDPQGAADGPLLVLGHALGGSPVLWDAASPLLMHDFRVSALTLPGHGDAPTPSDPFSLAELAEAVAEATRELSGGERALFAGLSISGGVALELALHRPDVFDAVASLASGAELGGRAQWGERAETVRAHSTSVLVEPSKQRWFAPETLAQRGEMVERILGILEATDDESYVRCCEALAGYDLRAELDRIAIPVLAVWGEHDSVGTEERQDEIVSGVQRGAKVRIDGAAHQLPSEQPEATAQLLREFFARDR